jgi:hypothetical protein
VRTIRLSTRGTAVPKLKQEIPPPQAAQDQSPSVGMTNVCFLKRRTRKCNSLGSDSHKQIPGQGRGRKCRAKPRCWHTRYLSVSVDGTRINSVVSNLTKTEGFTLPAATWRPSSAIKKRGNRYAAFIDPSELAGIMLFFLALFIIRATGGHGGIGVDLAPTTHATLHPGALKEDSLSTWL